MSQYLPARTAPIRIGDAERDQAVSMLSEHFVAGRLSQDEFEERSDQATRARYADDISPLFADLPDPAAIQPDPPAYRRGTPRCRPGLWLAPMLLIGLITVAIVLTAPWILFGLFLFALFSRPRNHHHHWRQHTYTHHR